MRAYHRTPLIVRRARTLSISIIEQAIDSAPLDTPAISFIMSTVNGSLFLSALKMPSLDLEVFFLDIVQAYPSEVFAVLIRLLITVRS